MGNYVFSTRTLLRLLHDDAADETSSHDFGRDILPKLTGKPRSSLMISRAAASPASRPMGCRTGATWGPSIPTTKPTWTCAPSPRRSTSTTGMAAAHNRLPGPAGQVHVRRREPPRPSHRFDRLRRLSAFGRRGAELRAGTQRPRACRRPGGRLRHPRQLRYWPPFEDSPCDSG